MNKEELFHIGIGTWKIDCESFNEELEALLHSYKNGQNYLPLYMLYDNGEVVRKMKSFIDKVDRNKLFITATLEPTIEKIEDVEKEKNSDEEINNKHVENEIKKE